MYVLDNTSEDIQVINIEWERIFLKIDVAAPGMSDLKFKLRSFDRRSVPMKSIKKDILEQYKQMIIDDPGRSLEYDFIAEKNIDINYIFEEVDITPESYNDGIYHFQFNIVAMNGREFLENGRWQMVAVAGDEEFNCSLCDKVAYELDSLSRIFRYDRGKYCYTVTFSTYNSLNDDMCFVMDSFFYIENKDWRKRRYVQEATTRTGKFKRVYMYAVIVAIRVYYHIFDHVFPKRGKNVMLMTETKPYIWGNLLYIDKRLRERGLDKQFNITHSCRVAVGSHTSVVSWIKVVTQIAKQDFIFVDDYVPIFGFFNLGKKTKLIQVWHAGVGFKSVGYSRFGKAGSPYPQGSCHKKYDYAVTGSEDLVHVYEEVFGIEKEAFLPAGMARLDGFLDPERIADFRKEFYNEYPDLKNKKIILFAPTYRGAGQKDADYDYGMLDLDRLYEFCGDEWVFMFKMHPFVRFSPIIPDKYKDRILDFSFYENINDLYYVTEMLITDYSSAYFEFSLMEKPILFFTYDREAYELRRGVHKPVKETAPGKVCDTFDEIITAMENQDYELQKTLDFKERNFGGQKGLAADTIIDTILLGKTDESVEETNEQSYEG